MTINVLHIRDTGDMLGAESVIFEIAKNSTQFNVKAVVGVLEGGSTELVQKAKENNINSFIIPCKGKIDFKTINFLKKYIKDNDIHIVHAHGYKENFYAWLSKSTPIIATNHLWKRTTMALKFYAYVDSKIMNKLEKVVAVSKPILIDMSKAGVKDSKCELISNGIDIQRFSKVYSSDNIKTMKQALNIPLDNTVIGMISSLSKEKGHEGAIKCFDKMLKKYPKLHFLVVGAGEEELALKKLSRKLNILQNICFAGRRTDIPEIHSIIDIYLLNSLIEGLPMALLEAMASAKAVIATNVGDVESVVIDNETGLLIQCEDLSGLESALLDLIEDSFKRNVLGQIAKEFISKHFSSISMTEKYINLYRELLQ